MRAWTKCFPRSRGGLTFTGSDEGDYHVHAAAISSRADVILTQNHPADITRTPDDEPYEIYTADDFFMLIVTSNPGCLLPCTAGQVEYWGPRGGGQLYDRLVRADCPQFADRVRKALQTLAMA